MRNLLLLLILLLFAIPLEAQHDNLPPKLKREAEKILKWSKDETLIEAVRRQNRSAMTMEDILKIDHDWNSGSVSEDFSKSLITNACAVRLKELLKAVAGGMEALVMDQQGALVCSTVKTTDYYQGDETKWSDAIKAKEGTIAVEKRQYDESSKATLQHVSTPIVFEGKNIGVVSVGININKLAEEE